MFIHHVRLLSTNQHDVGDSECLVVMVVVVVVVQGDGTAHA